MGQEDPLEEGMASYSSILAWRIPWSEKPGGLQSIGSERIWHSWNNWACRHKSLVYGILKKVFRTYVKSRNRTIDRNINLWLLGLKGGRISWKVGTDIHALPCCAESLSHVRLCTAPWTAAPRLLCPWDSPGKSTGVGCHARLQGIFLTQRSNPGLPHCRWILYIRATREAQEHWGG